MGHIVSLTKSFQEVTVHRKNPLLLTIFYGMLVSVTIRDDIRIRKMSHFRFSLVKNFKNVNFFILISFQFE